MSRNLDSVNGDVLAEAIATKGLPTAEGSRAPDGTAVISISQNAKNPLSPGLEGITPGIAAHLSIEIAPDGSAAKAAGIIKQFPAYELSIITPDGQQVVLFEIVPDEDATPWSLFWSQPVGAQAPLPSTP